MNAAARGPRIQLTSRLVAYCLRRQRTTRNPALRHGGEFTLGGIKQFSRIVGAVNAATAEPATWQEVVSRVGTSLDASAATIAVGLGSTRTVLVSSFAVEATAPYVERFRKQDFIMAACDRAPIGAVTGGWQLVQSHLRTEFYREWQNRFDATDGLFVRLNTATPTSLVVSAPRRAEPFASTERIDFIDALLSHLQRALALSALLVPGGAGGGSGDIGVHGDEMGVAADGVRHGLVLVDARARPTGVNEAARAMSARRDGIELRRGAFTLADAGAHELLRAAVGRATTSAGLRVSAQVVCPRPPGRRPYVVHVTPVGDDPARPRALLTVVDPDDRPAPPPELLRALFGLTPAESRVALSLLHGETTEESALRLGLAVATVKTHLVRVFRKTGTTRQADLVRLLLTLQP